MIDEVLSSLVTERAIHGGRFEYLIHPDAFFPIVQKLHKDRLGILLNRSCVLDASLYLISQRIYDVATSRTLKKTPAEEFTRGMRNIVQNLHLLKLLPYSYLQVVNLGRELGLHFLDAYHVYTAKKFRLELVVEDDEKDLTTAVRCLKLNDYIAKG